MCQKAVPFTRNKPERLKLHFHDLSSDKLFNLLIKYDLSKEDTCDKHAWETRGHLQNLAENVRPTLSNFERHFHPNRSYLTEKLHFVFIG